MKTKTFLNTFLLLIITQFSFAQIAEATLKQDFKKEVLTPRDLKEWPFYGIGKAYTEIHNQFCIAEATEGSKGAMIVSPKDYGKNIIVRYKAMTLTPASVLVAMLSASNHKKDELIIPEHHDGAMPFWLNNVDCYFFAFRNAPHNFTPFLRKFPKSENSNLASAKENTMHSGIFYDIEIGRLNDTLWLKIDGKLMFKTIDKNPLSDGKIAFRTRGTAGFRAAFLMKNLEIYYKEK